MKNKHIRGVIKLGIAVVIGWCIGVLIAPLFITVKDNLEIKELNSEIDSINGVNYMQEMAIKNSNNKLIKYSHLDSIYKISHDKNLDFILNMNDSLKYKEAIRIFN